MHLHRFLLSLAVLAFLSGCASKVSLSSQSASGLKQSTLAHTERPFPELVMFSLKDATAGIVGGAVGGAVAGAMGNGAVNQAITEAGTSNPNEVFRTALLDRLEASYALRVLGSTGVAMDDKQRAIDYENSSTEAEYVLDSSVGWFCSYLPLNWVRYQFQVGFVVTISHRASREVVFSENFVWKTPKEMGFPTVKEFTTDPERGVQAQLAAACTAAVAHFEKLLIK